MTHTWWEQFSPLRRKSAGLRGGHKPTRVAPRVEELEARQTPVVTGSWSPIADTNVAVDSATISFTEAVQGVSLDDFTLDGALMNTLQGVTLQVNSPTSYTITGLAAHTGAGNPATYTVGVDGGNNIQDLANTPLANAPAESWLMDGTAPTVTVSQGVGQADPTSSSPILFSVVFSEPVTGFDSTDITLSGTANPVTGVVIEVAPNNGTTFQLNVSGMTQSGTVVVNVLPNRAIDAFNNGNLASAGGDNSVTYNLVPVDAPSAAWIPIGDTNTAVNSATISFTEDVQGVTPNAFTLNGVGLDTLAGVTIQTNSPSSYTITGLAAHTNVGNPNTTYTLAVAAGNDIQDLTGNALVNAPAEPWLMDSTAPTVTINQAAGQSDPSGTSPILFTVVFSEPVSGFGDNDVVLGGTAGASMVSVAQVAPNNGTTYQVTVTGMTHGGTVTASVGPNRAIDARNNANVAAAGGDNTVTFSLNLPGPPEGAWAPIADTTTAVDSATITFNEDVQNVTVDDFTLNGVGLDTLAGVSVQANSASSFTLLGLAAHTGQGNPNTNYTLALSGTNNIRDLGNNALANGPMEAWLMDTTAPAVTVNVAAGQADPTGTGPILFTVVFSEPVTGFDPADVTPGGTALPTTGVVTEVAPNDGTTYQVAISGMARSGTVNVTVAANRVNDPRGNANLASTSTDNTVTFAFSAPPASSPPPPPPPASPPAVFGSLTMKRVGKGKKAFVMLRNSAGASRELLLPYQKPAFRSVQVVAIDTNGDGIPDAVRVTARRGKKSLSSIFRL